MRRQIARLAVAGLLAPACASPLGGPGLPSTADLINGAAKDFSNASSLEISGSFNQSGYHYTIDMQVTPPSTARVTMSQNNLQLEAVQVGGKVYFRGRDFLAKTVATNPAGPRLAKAIGAGWFTSKDTNLLDMSNFTEASKVKANFFNTLSVKRKDNVGSDGVKTAELAGTDYTLYITETSPHRLVYLRAAKATTLSDVTDAELAFTNYNKDFGIRAPTAAFDLDDHGAWPPLYFRISMDASRCDYPCILSAVFQNEGGTAAAPGPSTITFTLTNKADGSSFGSCTVAIQPDVPNGAQVTKSCSITSAAFRVFTGTYLYNAVIANPAYD
jgi:hypothetical protein